MEDIIHFYPCEDTSRDPPDSPRSAAEVTPERVLLEYARLAFFDPRRLFAPDGKPKGIHELDEDTAAAVTGLDLTELYDGTGKNKTFTGFVKKYRLTDKKSALDSLSKHLGIFDGRGAKSPADGQDDPITQALKEAADHGLF